MGYGSATADHDESHFVLLQKGQDRGKIRPHSLPLRARSAPALPQLAGEFRKALKLLEPLLNRQLEIFPEERAVHIPLVNLDHRIAPRSS
jgi:hypothetical protein